MITHGLLTAAVVAGFGLVELWDMDYGTPWAFLFVILSANLGLFVAQHLRTSSPSALPGRQQRLMALVEETLPHLRMGLSEETAHRTVRQLHDAMRFEAVGITDRDKLLAFVGPGSDHHLPGQPIASSATLRAMQSGEVTAVGDRSRIECYGSRNGACPLGSAVVAPLLCGPLVVGSLRVYRTVEGMPGRNLVELVEGLAGMLSLQLELAQAHRDAQMADIAKLDALRAQINPHFLFNMLNTITMKARTDPDQARRLLVRLSDFLRYAMKGTGHLATFAEEYFFVRTYLFLEKARFEGRLRVRYEVDPQVLSIPVPVLTIQPLVENAVKHGIAPRPEGGRVELKATLEPIAGTLRIRVCDDGVGIEPARATGLLTPAGPGGRALANINERLVRLYGGRASMDIDSSASTGTVVSLSLPVT